MNFMAKNFSLLDINLFTIATLIFTTIKWTLH